jgi:hypothetical protein
VNTAKSPVTQLSYGNNFSKYLLQIDLDVLKTKVQNGDISLNGSTKHYLHLTNCIFGDEDLLGEIADTQRASSFDLIVFKIGQQWDEGVGYELDEDYYSNTKQKLFSETASNWYNATTASGWTQAGVYTTNISGTTTAQIIATQHFDNGNEDLHVDITTYVNGILTGQTDYGIGVAFASAYEIIAASEYDQTVSFFSKYTQSFFEPYLETVYDDLVQDDRNTFTLGESQNLMLYVSHNNQRANLDALPTVDILDQSKNPISGYTGITTTKIAKGVYKVNLALTGVTMCDNKLYFFDKWNGLILNGVNITPVTQKFVPVQMDDLVDFGNGQPTQFVPFIYGIKKGEKINRGDVRKVIVEAKEIITARKSILSDIYYRIYVKEGKGQVEVQGWTQVNKTNKENNFFLDTSFLIPKEYFIDIKINYNSEITTLNNVVNFQIVSEK